MMSLFKLRWVRRLLVVLTSVVLLFSIAVTIADGRVSFLPTWEELYAWSGFHSPVVGDDELRLTSIYVGNADCLLLQSGSCNVLVDTGESRRFEDIEKALSLRGVKRLDHVIASHIDADHIGAMSRVIEKFEVGTVWIPPISPLLEPSDRAYLKLREAVDKKGLPLQSAMHGDTMSIGAAELTFIQERAPVEFTAENHHSLICRVTLGEHTFLLMGDADAAAERKLMDSPISLEADVLKVGHHGSRTSSHSAFIQEVDPEIAIITCGFDNSYGHPHDETLDILESVGAEVYRGDLLGTISVTSDGTTLSVTHKR